MARSVYRLIWLHEWQVNEMESWLEDLAMQGLHLEKIGTKLATFHKGESQNLQYKVDIFNKKDKLAGKRIKAYQQAGWKHIGEQNLMQIFCAPENTAIPDIHSDLSELTHSAKRIQRQLILNIMLFVPAIIVLYFSYVVFSFNRAQLILYDISFSAAGLLLFNIDMAYANIRGLIYMIGYKREINHGSLPLKAGHTTYSLRRFLNFAIYFAATLLLIWPVFSFIASNQMTEIPAGNLPVVRLAEIEQNSRLTPAPLPYLEDYYSEGWSTLAPQQYYLRERFLIEEANYTAMLISNSYISPTPYLAEYLYNFLTFDEEKRFGPLNSYTHTTLNVPEVDALWLAEGPISTVIIALKDNIVVYISYNGEKSSTELIVQIQELFARLD